MRITLHPSKPLSWWYNRRTSIDFDPPYQRRGRLWSDSDKSYLIDSILNGFDVPKLYFADFQFGESPLNTKKLPYAVIDGKQRLEAIFDFFDGKISLNEGFVWRQDKNLSLGGLSLKDLRAKYSYIAEIFETETVDIMSVVTNDADDINELFIRLNRSKPLTGAEVRNAMKGPVPDIIRIVASHSFFKENIKFSVARAEDYNAAAKLIIFEYTGKPVNTKKGDLDRFAKEGGDLDLDRLHLAGRKCIDTLDVMQEIFLPRDPLLASAGPLPVYYWVLRQLGPDKSVGFREFLKQFEHSRSQHRAQQVSGLLTAPIEDLARYDALSRSVNDSGSHTGRAAILIENFSKWV